MRTLLLILGACAGPSDDTPSGSGDTDTGGETGDSPQLGACGEVTRHDLSIVGAVEDSEGAPVVGASIHLEERFYEHEYQIWGDGVVTDEEGRFSFVAEQIVSVEDCWGIVLDYVLVAELEGRRAEDGNVNSILYNAILNGTTADFTFFPMVLED